MLAGDLSPRLKANLPDDWRFDDLLASTDIGVWSCDLPFDTLNWDTKVKQHFWLPPEAAVTIQIFYERLHPDDRDRTRQAIETSIPDRKNYDIEYRTVSDAGHVRWVRAIGRVLYGDSGEPVRFDGGTVDIYVEKQKQQ